MKILKIAGIALASIVGILLIAFFVAKFTIGQAEPQGTVSPQADQLAQAMMQSVDKVAWDSTRYVQWSFRNEHHYLWDKESHWVQIKWDDNRVVLNTKNHTTGQAFVNGTEVSEDKRIKLVNTAWSYFCNDSFWLNPVVKAFDPGTERSIVEADGKKMLKVQYTSGGVTPGDSYLWTLDENNRPTSWQMWTQILPIDGFPMDWKGWTELSTGAWISTVHSALGSDTEMINNPKGGMNLSDIGVSSNPFSTYIK